MTIREQQWPDFVHEVCKVAAERFGGEDGIFNGAQFAGAMRDMSGVEQTLDGGMVRAILRGRADVVPLAPGDAHYRLVSR